MAKAPAENHFYNSLRLNDGGLGMTTPDVAYWPVSTILTCRWFERFRGNSGHSARASKTTLLTLNGHDGLSLT
jgi:hypothetical protein